MPVLRLYLMDITAPLKIPRMSKLTYFFFPHGRYEWKKYYNTLKLFKEVESIKSGGILLSP